MRRTAATILFSAVIVVVTLAGLSLAAYAQTADEIVAKSIQAEGGMARLKAIQTARVSGYAEAPGMRAEIVEVKKRPNRIRREFDFGRGATGLEVYDGQKGWQVSPGKADPETVAGDDLKTLMEDADFDGPLLDYRQKGNKVELVGKEKVGATDTYHLKVTLKDGTVRNYYISAESFLAIRVTGKATAQGQETEFDMRASDFRDVQGIKVPFKIEHHSQTAGEEVALSITFVKFEFDVPVDDSLFQMPAPGKSN